MTETSDWGSFYLGLYGTLFIVSIACLGAVVFGASHRIAAIGLASFGIAIVVALDFKYRIRGGDSQ